MTLFYAIEVNTVWIIF